MVIRIEMNAEDVSNEVRRYSILVGFLLIVVFVVPCVGFALLSKYCQKQTRKRRVSVLSNKHLSLHSILMKFVYQRIGNYCLLGRNFYEYAIVKFYIQCHKQWKLCNLDM